MIVKPDNITRLLKYSVGESGVNMPNDVTQVQTMLNILCTVLHLRGAGFDPNETLIVNGSCDDETIEAIMEFQRRFCGYMDPNGFIEPFGRTHRQLYNMTADKMWTDKINLWSLDIRKSFSYDWEANLGNPEDLPKVADAYQLWTETDNLTEEFKLFVATVNGEAGGCSEVAWKAVAHVIMNRINHPGWKHATTVTYVIEKTGFDAPHDPNCTAFVNAKNKLDKNSYQHDRHLVKLISILKPIYNKEESDFTNGANQYYSPKAQKYGHKHLPNIYKHDVPVWATDGEFENVEVSGLKESDDFIFLRKVMHQKNKDKSE